MDFKAGDVVKLKSGGPLMTVDSVGNYSGVKKVLCVWFENSNRYTNLFVPESLLKIS